MRCTVGNSGGAAGEADLEDGDDIPSDLQIDPSDMEALTALIEAGDDSALMRFVADEAQIAGDSQPDIQDVLQKKLGAVNTLKGEADRLRSEMDLTEGEIKKQQRDVENLRLSLKRLDSKESLYKEVQRQVVDKEQQLNQNSQVYVNLQKQLDVMLSSMRKETEDIRDLEERLRSGQTEQNAEMRRELEGIIGKMQGHLALSRQENETNRAEYARLLEEKRALEQRLADLERLRQVQARKTADASASTSNQPATATDSDAQQQRKAADEALEMALSIKREKMEELNRMRGDIESLESELQAQRERQAELRKRLARSEDAQLSANEATRRQSATEKYLNESTAEQLAKQPTGRGSTPAAASTPGGASSSKRALSSNSTSNANVNVNTPTKATNTNTSMAANADLDEQFVEETSVRRGRKDAAQAQPSRLPVPMARGQAQLPRSVGSLGRKDTADGDYEAEDIEEVEVYSPNPLTQHRAARRTGSESNSDVELLVDQRFANSGDVFVNDDVETTRRDRRHSGPVAYTLDALLRDGTLGRDGDNDVELPDIPIFDEEDVDYPEPDNPPPDDEQVEPREFNDELEPTRLRATADDQTALDGFVDVDSHDDADVDEMFVVLQQNPNLNRDRIP